MTAEVFNELVERKLSETRNQLIRKGAEYAKGADRLSNFKAAGMLLGEPPEKVLFGFVIKHFVALRDFIYDGGSEVTIEAWAEKTGDVRNYMILLDALVEERLAEPTLASFAEQLDDLIAAEHKALNARPCPTCGEWGGRHTTWCKMHPEELNG